MRGVKTKRGGFRLLPMAAGMLILAAGSAVAEDRTCEISQVSGQASLTHEGKRAKAATGSAVSARDTLRTGGDGRVEILCSDGVVVTIGAETELGLGSLVGEQGPSESIAMSLHRGIARFLAPLRTWGQFNVHGPVAVASVRSTEWVMETPKRGTNVFVLDGSVTVRAKSGTGIILGPGHGVDVAADGTMGEGKTWGAERVEKTLKRLGLR
jgi:hypothetical protein